MNIQEEQIKRYSAMDANNEPLSRCLTAFRQLYAEARALNPLDDGYCALSVTLNGFNESPQSVLSLHVFYGSNYAFDVCSMNELRQKVAECNPEVIRLKRIAELEAELAALRLRVQPAEVA